MQEFHSHEEFDLIGTQKDVLKYIKHIFYLEILVLSLILLMTIILLFSVIIQPSIADGGLLCLFIFLTTMLFANFIKALKLYKKHKANLERMENEINTEAS